MSRWRGRRREKEGFVRLRRVHRRAGPAALVMAFGPRSGDAHSPLPAEAGRLLDHFVRVGYLVQPAAGDVVCVGAAGVEYVSERVWRRTRGAGR